MVVKSQIGRAPRKRTKLGSAGEISGYCCWVDHEEMKKVELVKSKKW
jgi:hypothetical protein